MLSPIFDTLEQAVDALSKQPFAIVAPALPDGNAAGGHLSLADATVDSAILEYLNGKLKIHHSPKYTVIRTQHLSPFPIAANFNKSDVSPSSRHDNSLIACSISLSLMPRPKQY